MAGPPRGHGYDPDLLAGDRNRALGSRIREARIASGLSYRDLAAAMRARGHAWTEETVSTVQTGRARKVWATELPALAGALGVHVGWLMMDIPEDDTPPPVRPLADQVFDYQTAPVGRLARQLWHAAARLAKTPNPALTPVADDLREAAELLIPAALYLEDGQAPEMPDEVADPARPDSTSKGQHFQAFFGMPGQLEAVDQVAAEHGWTRAATLRRIIASALPAWTRERVAR